MSRSRLTDPSRIENQWGKPLGKQAARTPSGLYGYPKQIQSSCESSVRKLRKAALKIVKAAYQKDAKVAEFLTTHARRNKSVPAKVLLATLNEARPVFGKYGVEGGKTAAGGRYGLYGYPAKTASLGVQACAQFREAAGHIASDLHRRKAAKYGRITGFLKDHWKQGKCGYSRMLHASYPDETMRLASAKGEGINEYNAAVKWQDRGDERRAKTEYLEAAKAIGHKVEAKDLDKIQAEVKMALEKRSKAEGVSYTLHTPKKASVPTTVAAWLGEDKTASSYLTVVPAYGKDYKSKAQVMQAWNEGKDFQINDMSSRYDGSYINKQDADNQGGLRAINIRYNGLRKVVVINL